MVRNFVSWLGSQGEASQERLVTPRISTARGKIRYTSIHHAGAPRGEHQRNALLLRLAFGNTPIVSFASIRSPALGYDLGYFDDEEFRLEPIENSFA